MRCSTRASSATCRRPRRARRHHRRASSARARDFQEVLDRARLVGQRAAVPDRRARAHRHHQRRPGRRRLRAAGRAHDRPPCRPRSSARWRARTAGCRAAPPSVVAMGKLGGREMTAASDLDLILIYDFDAAATQSDGARPLAPDAVLHAPDAAPDQRLHRADRRGQALRGRHAPAALRPEGARRHAAFELHRLPGQRGLDLGAPGA